jgi:SRSO17 transposase
VAALARVDDVEASRLLAGLDDAFALVAGRFFRREVRVRARACLAGMLSGLERKTGWSLAEHAGEAGPGGMQRLFATARWDHDAVRDDVRAYAAAALGDPDGVLTGDDTGFEKKGARSAGVQRQYTGTAGKITNCQLGVFLAYASPKGRALVDRELYLPRSWTADEARLAGAGVPDGTGFRTKPQLLQAMIERAIAAGTPFGWVTADEAYGDNGPLRAWLEEQQVSYVLAVSRDHVITTPAGRRRADALAGALPEGRLAAAVVRGRRERPPLVRLGRHRDQPQGDLPTRPPLGGQAVRAGLLPVPHAAAGPARPPREDRRRQVGG